MEGNKVVHLVGKDIEHFSLEDLKKAVNKLEKGDLYSDIIMNAINSADEKDIGGALFMWLCRYLELEILKLGEKIELPEA